MTVAGVGVDNAYWMVAIGAPLVTATIIALVTWVLRLLAQRRKLETTDHAVLVKNVDDLATAVRDITYALGGSPATPFTPARVGLVDNVAALTSNVETLTGRVEQLERGGKGAASHA